MCKDKKNVAEIITERLIKKINSEGKLPWMKPFISFRRNYISGYVYKGINSLILSKSCYYITYKQLKDYNKKHKTDYYIYKPEEYEVVVFYKKNLRELNEDEKGKYLKGEKVLNLEEIDGVPYIKHIVLRYTKVYPIEYIIDSKGNNLPDVNIKEEKKNLSAEDIISNYMAFSNVKLYTDSPKAYYSPSEDVVHVPPVKNFKNVEFSYRVRFHEIGHSTGVKSRLNRSCFDNYHKTKPERSREELVAELTSLLLATEAGFTNEECFETKNSDSYILSWLEYLNNNPKEIIYAMSLAEKARDYILGKNNE